LRIRVERSGGIAGITISNEMDSKDLPSTLRHTVNKIVQNKNISSLSVKSSPRGAADHYNYKISVQDGTNQSVIECNQYTSQDDLKSLIKYVERNSSKVK
jgi:hypothetical protein